MEKVINIGREGGEEIISLTQEPIILSGGAVNSVNGQTGNVVLTTSDLENTSDYQTGDEVESAINTAIAGKQNMLTAGANIAIIDNTISAVNTTYSDFTGTDGNMDGTEGLVPAPVTTDVDKFLKSDGTWGEAGGDTVYSDKNTSISSTGGAVYIGNLDANQDEQPDPTTTDNHYKYFWALPNNNSEAPNENSVNILGATPGIQGVIIGDGAYGASTGYYNICIGSSAGATGSAGSTVNVGFQATSAANNSVAIGRFAKVQSITYQNSVALGSFAAVSRRGEVNIGTGGVNLGYNNTDYRVIGGVHDGQGAHDAVTVGQLNATIDAINTALGSNIPHVGA